MIKLTINRYTSPEKEYGVSISVDKEIQEIKRHETVQEAYNHVKRIQKEIPFVKLEISRQILEEMLNMDLYIVEEL